MPTKPSTEISVEVRRISERAYLVDNGLEDGDGYELLVWIPKSQVLNRDELNIVEYDTYEFVLPDWFIEKTGLM